MNTFLDRLCRLETFQAIIHSLTPEQLVVVALRLDGLGVSEAAQELGVSRQVVEARLKSAQKRAREHLADYDLEDRRCSRKPLQKLSMAQLRILAAVDHLTEVGIPASPTLVCEYLSISNVRKTMERMVINGLLVRAEKVESYQTYRIADGILKEEEVEKA